MQLNYSPKTGLISLDSEFKTIAVGCHRIHMQQTDDTYFVDVYSGANCEPVLTISVDNDYGYTETANQDGSYTWIFHPLEVTVGLNNITTSTLNKSRMWVTFKPTYRGVTDEDATEIMEKILDRAQLPLYQLPAVEYTRGGEFQFYLDKEEDLPLFRLEDLMRKVHTDASLRDELEICNLEVEYI